MIVFTMQFVKFMRETITLHSNEGPENTKEQM